MWHDLFLRKIAARVSGLSGLIQRAIGVFASSRSVSNGYVLLPDDGAQQEASRLSGAWQSHQLPARQRDLVDLQLAAYRRGEPIEVFDVIVQALRALPGASRDRSLLEIGCSSGYYSEVISIAGFEAVYTGCDYSPAFIELARKTYPSLQFHVEDATALGYSNDSFSIVISGCCLLHIPEYERAIAESTRVARDYVIFHRTPVVLGKPTSYFRKLAYGVETVEIHLNEPLFLALLTKCGLSLIARYTLSEVVENDIGSANRTYVCKKINV